MVQGWLRKRSSLDQLGGGRMKLFVLYRYFNYGTLNERKEVMSVCTDITQALKISDKYKYHIETIEANKVRIPGGPMRADTWKDV